MAKTCMVAREKRRIVKSKRAYNIRAALKKMVKSIGVDWDEKVTAMHKLEKRDRDESRTRVRRRCASCGRPRAVYRKFRLCRICLRQAAMRGDIPGLVKSSW